MAMRIRMNDTTREQRVGTLVGGNVYDVPDDLGDRLIDQGIALKSQAKQTTAQEQAPEAPAAPGGNFTASVSRQDAEALSK